MIVHESKALQFGRIGCTASGTAVYAHARAGTDTRDSDHIGCYLLRSRLGTATRELVHVRDVAWKRYRLRSST